MGKAQTDKKWNQRWGSIRNSVKEWIPKLSPFLVTPAVLQLLYAQPWFAAVGLLLISTTMLSLTWIQGLAPIPERRRRLRLVCGSAITFAIVLLAANDYLEKALLDWGYGTCFHPKGHFDRKIEQLDSGFGKDDSLWQISLRQADRHLKVPADDGGPLAQLPFATLRSNQRLFLLLGPAGTGKTPLLKQWAMGLLRTRSFNEIFFVSLKDKSEIVLQSNSIEEFLAKVHSTVIPESKYYMLLLEKKDCLVVLDDLDEITSKDREHILELCANSLPRTRARFIIGSRPDAVAESSRYERELQHMPSVCLLHIEPLKESAIKQFITTQVTRTIQSEDDRARVSDALKNRIGIHAKSRLMSGILTEVDYINRAIQLAMENDHAESSDYEWVDKLVELRAKRNEETHWKTMKVNRTERMSAIAKEAFEMSLHGTSE
ncbi:MAG: NACHT domain-containing protein, partial [Planctomycetales bacterium]|nr:NACHT domain-containing protein [Planctomycetales bacterium]